LKRVIVILTVVIALGTVYFLIQIDRENQTKYSAKGINNQPTELMKLDITKHKRAADIEGAADMSQLIIDFKLKPAKLNLPDSIYWNNSSINLSAMIPSSVRICDIYLLCNRRKTDMFYRIHGGTYQFKNISLEKGENLLEVFYKMGKRRSKSSSSIVIRE
jgi:hypothetical protein